jgi:hypothetical protein
LFGSRRSSTQPPGQKVSPGGHWQAPDVHT